MRCGDAVDPGTDRTALAIRHVAFEDLGILAPLLVDRGYCVRYLDAGVDELSEAAVVGADLLVVLGGPIGVGDAARYPFVGQELRTIAARLAQRKPTLGICLGAQLIAAALGASVTPTGRIEIGYAPITLTQSGRSGALALLGGTPVLHWHGDQFEIPAGTVRMAETPGYPNQAFAGPNVLGLQFHLEADHTQIERWLVGHAHELAVHRIDPRSVRADARAHGPELAVRAGKIFGTWLTQLDRAALHSTTGPEGAHSTSSWR
ncbi:glutamine amidotransferase [Kribbella sancticallisti]|uniref:Glutamine amidotransferase n=1 Tax=Kribbella sancticallisti TaxID=460087 RepID=A0ABP4MWP8_9ACTN